MKHVNKILFVLVFLGLTAFDWEKPNVVDGISTVTLTFSPKMGGDDIVVQAVDPDGAGPEGFAASGDIELSESTDYSLAITIENAGGDATSEIVNNPENYQFFFGWTDEVFLSPEGDGNADANGGTVDYTDQDGQGRSIGLATDWTTDCGEETSTGTFRVVLQNVTGVKSDTTSINSGTTDFDFTWTVNVNEDPDAPPCENEEEVITDVILNFVPTAGGDTIKGIAIDPDGPGPLSLQVQGEIDLLESTDYTLTLDLLNSIERGKYHRRN